MDSKLAKAKGHERFKLREAADRLDFLRAIPGGPPLGLFVAGMARYARKAKMFPDRYSQNGFGPIRTVREFDDAITAPCFGYRDAEEYYEAAGAKKVVGCPNRVCTKMSSKRCVRTGANP